LKLAHIYVIFKRIIDCRCSPRNVGWEHGKNIYAAPVRFLRFSHERSAEIQILEICKKN
jgi:hypothetical protein